MDEVTLNWESEDAGNAVLVAGGAGFVGSHLCARLLGERRKVICLDNLLTGRRINLSSFEGHPNFSFIVHDVTEPLPEFHGVREIFHLASPASPLAYQRYPVETMRANSEGTRQLLEFAARHGARFLFASTSEVYGDPIEHPQSEEYRGNVSCTGPRSMYDEAKRFGEAFTVAFGTAHEVETRIARIFNTYGPRMDPGDGRVVSNFIVEALREQPLKVYGNGSQTRSFQYIDDLIEALLRLMASDYREPVNVGNEAEFTILELAEIVLTLTGSASPIVYESLPVDDPVQRRPNVTRAKAVLDWAASIPLEDGLESTIAYFRSKLVPARLSDARIQVGR